MPKEETTPSESEWAVMEILWEEENCLTSAEIIEKLQGSMASKMVRVLLNRLYKKKIIDYVSDKKDARVYRYFPLKSREKCLQEKSRRFADSYFSGSGANAFAALLRNITLTEEQIQELEGIIEENKGKHSEGRRKH
ncbi:BlaI/MecI/CopY family transcriptional regulator [Petralouisia muris]|uniref:BlaI/MecI/CopY family transcriptional regulator n=1 Tax=Petralouisia muris TaxID=3032872 RepID=A0AC61S1D4_9FIRM|nr:BlaI/MecI/CopY family transcriptional regulator [Petralouisia muris]TGY98239.1 BlaI/MecI/CopY family transcriptional regulator [Petralouisia muris]